MMKLYQVYTREYYECPQEVGVSTPHIEEAIIEAQSQMNRELNDLEPDIDDVWITCFEATKKPLMIWFNGKELTND